MRLRTRILLVAGVLFAAAIGVSVWSHIQAQRNAKTLTLYGNVDIREVELSFRVPGRLQTMYFDEGDGVDAGALVAEIDPEPYRAAFAVDDARVQQAQANLEKLESGSRPQEVARARAAVREAQAAYDDAQRELTRQIGLLKTGASSEKSHDSARARRDETAATLASAREALALAEEGFRSEEIEAARADLAAARAQRDLSETRLEDTKLTAPSHGTLIARIREPGSMLGAGTPVYSLSLRDPIYVRAYVDEPHLGALAPGDEVEITTDSSDHVYHGQIGFISPRAEFTPKSVETTELRTDLVYRLRIVVRDGDEALRQGMPVTVHVPLEPAGR